MEQGLNKESYTELMEKSAALLKEKEYKEVIKTCKIIKIMYGKTMDSNALASLYIRMANSYYSLEDKDKATYYYEEYLKVCPKGQTSVFSRLANAYYYIDQDKSIDYHNKSLNLEISDRIKVAIKSNLTDKMLQYISNETLADLCELESYDLLLEVNSNDNIAVVKIKK